MGTDYMDMAKKMSTDNEELLEELDKQSQEYLQENKNGLELRKYLIFNEGAWLKDHKKALNKEKKAVMVHGEIYRTVEEFEEAYQMGILDVSEERYSNIVKKLEANNEESEHLEVIKKVIQYLRRPDVLEDLYKDTIEKKGLVQVNEKIDKERNK